MQIYFICLSNFKWTQDLRPQLTQCKKFTFPNFSIRPRSAGRSVALRDYIRCYLSSWDSPWSYSLASWWTLLFSCINAPQVYVEVVSLMNPLLLHLTIHSKYSRKKVFILPSPGPESRAEFLKAAITQSYDWSKYLRICAKFGLMNARQEKLAHISCICHNLTKFSSFLWQFNACFCAKFPVRAFQLSKRTHF